MGRSRSRTQRRIRKRRARGGEGGYLARMARNEEEWNRDLTPEFQAILQRYALIMPPPVTTIADLERQVEESPRPDGAPFRRLACLLWLAGAHIKEGHITAATNLLDEAEMQHNRIGHLRLL